MICYISKIGWMDIYSGIFLFVPIPVFYFKITQISPTYSLNVL